MIELGRKGKDKITGFEGIIMARHQYLTGCDQYTIVPAKNKNGGLDDAYQFDEGRIEITGEGIAPNNVQTETKGGPQHVSLPSK